MSIISAFIIGIIFGTGLIISGMIYPSKVIGFLDLAGNWDPSLGLVMLGAIITASVAFYFIRNRKQSYLGISIQLPKSKNIDKRLLIGGLLFGIGWGIAGICPGPAIVDLGTANSKVIVFFVAMLVGMYGFSLVSKDSHTNK